jgi:hypothetical protein
MIRTKNHQLYQLNQHQLLKQLKFQLKKLLHQAVAILMMIKLYQQTKNL